MERQLESATLCVVRWHEPFEILRGTYTRQRFAPHLHESFALGAIEAGASRIRYRGRTVRQLPGDVVVIPAREVHTGEADAPMGWSYRMLYLPETLVATLAPPGRQDFREPSLPDPELASRIVALHASLERGTDPLRGQTALAEILHRLHVRHGSTTADACHGGEKALLLRRVRDHLEENYAHPVTLSQLALLAGISPFHLIRQFRARYGLPPYMYLELVRVNRAREMLRAGEPISRVAYATGFSDQSHLTRRFKRVVGVPPGQYARTYGALRPGSTTRHVA
jgi:AraC-like DNA-binding protein